MLDECDVFLWVEGEGQCFLCSIVLTVTVAIK